MSLTEARRVRVFRETVEERFPGRSPLWYRTACANKDAGRRSNMQFRQQGWVPMVQPAPTLNLSKRHPGKCVLSPHLTSLLTFRL